MPPRIDPRAREQISFDYAPEDIIESISSWIPQSIKSRIPEPVKKAAKFGFEAFLPDPLEMPNPLGAAMNFPRKIVKQAGEELLDTLPRHLPRIKDIGIVKDVLNKHKSVLGYLGGEGNVVDRSSDVARETIDKYGADAFYRQMFEDTPDAKNFMDYLKDEPIESLEDLKYLTGVRRGKHPAISLNDLSLNRDTSLLKEAVEEELTHLGQDIAPKGVLRQTGDLPRSSIMYYMHPAEILAQSSRRLNQNIIPGMKYDERLRQGLRSMGMEGRAFGPRVTEDYFTTEILPFLQRYGK